MVRFSLQLTKEYDIMVDSPCNGVCSYALIDGVNMCTSCYRTYDDLEQWLYLDDQTKKELLKMAKERKRKYSEIQKN